MARIGDFDLCERLSPTVPIWVTQIGVGLMSVVAARIIRVIFDIAAGGAAPFALIYPAIMLATLFARALAGVVAAAIMIVYIWYYLYPIKNSFRFVDTAGAFAVAVVVATAIMTIIIAELFRRAARRATQERDREIADRDLFLAEFDHRMKNNFAIVAGLLDMQKRRASDPATVEALGIARMRVDSIARAHRHLYRGSQPGTVEMREYLGDLCAALSESLFLRGGISLTCDSDEAAVPRDRAVSIGLVVNELVTNAAKHAFPGRDLGSIVVSFRNRPDGGWTVTVADDGVGMPRKIAAPGPDHGLGSRLIEAFARQAGGTITTDSDPTGTRVVMEIAA